MKQEKAMNNRTKIVWFACLTVMLMASVLVMRTLLAAPTTVFAADGSTVATTHLTGDKATDLCDVGALLYTTADTEGAEKMNIGGTGTLTTVMGKSKEEQTIGDRINATDGHATVGTFEQDTDDAVRIHFDWYGLTLSTNQIVFETPVKADELQGLAIEVFLHTDAVAPFQTLANEYGIWIFASDDTGAAGEGLSIGATTKQDEWTMLYIPQEQLSLLAGSDGYIRGFQLGARLRWDVAGYGNLPDISSGLGADRGYIKFRSVSEATPAAISKAGTLKKVFGETDIYYDESHSRGFDRPITVVDDSGASGGKAYSLIGNWWGVVRSTNCILFDTPIDAKSEIDLRIYVDADVEDPYLTNKYDGFVLYPLGATGELIEGITLDPTRITQRQWVNYHLTLGEASKLATDDGWIHGFQIGVRFDWSLGNSYEPSIGNMHPAVEGEDDKAIIKIDPAITVTKYVPPPFDGYLTKGDKAAGGKSNFTQLMGWDLSDTAIFDNINHAINKADITVEDDATALNGKALKLNIFPWDVFISNNHIEFDYDIDVKDYDGLVVRLKLHIRDRQPYSTGVRGVFLFDKSSDGDENEKYMIPQETAQDEWVNVYIPKADMVRMAGKDGKIEGLQMAAFLHQGLDPGVYGETYILIDYIAASKNVDITFKDGNDVIKTDKAPTFFAGTNSYYIPKKDGHIFLGWKSDDDEYYDFATLTTKEFSLTADWVQEKTDLSSLYGLYRNGDKAVTVSEDGVTFENVVDSYSYYGVGTDNKLYIVNGTQTEIVDFTGSGWQKVVNYTVTYKTGIATNPTIVQLVEEGTTTTLPNVKRNGYKLIKWVDAQGVEFTADTVVNQNTELTAVYEPIVIEDVSNYLGTYYNMDTDTKIVLNASNKAKRITGGVESEQTYYVYADNVIKLGDDEGTLLGTYIELNGKNYLKLSKFYTVLFDTNGADSPDIDSRKADEDTDYKVRRPSNPTKEGYLFGGWFLSIDEKIKFDFDYVVAENITLYAYWIDPNAPVEPGEPEIPPEEDYVDPEDPNTGNNQDPSGNDGNDGNGEEPACKGNSGCGGLIESGVSVASVLGVLVLFASAVMIAKRKKHE